MVARKLVYVTLDQAFSSYTLTKFIPPAKTNVQILKIWTDIFVNE